MDFVTAISTGASIEYVVEEYAYAFLKAVTANPHSWCSKASHQFVGQCFQALGLKFNVSVAAFRETQDHPYRNDNANYIFDVVPFVLEGVDAFLDQLPQRLAHYGCQLKEIEANKELATAADRRFQELTQPLTCYLKMVLIWIKVVHAICRNMQLQSSSVDKFLCEPLARLSFSFVSGLAKLLPEYGPEFSGLSELCLMLTVYVRYGIFYEATSQVILTPMLDIFEKNCTTFCGTEKSALDFVYCVLSVVMPQEDGYVQAYQFLETIIKKLSRSQQRDQQGILYLRLFTNELISDKFLAIQFETLKAHQSRPLLLATLQYLMTLQRHIASAECFSLRFLEVILQVLLRLPLAANSVGTQAARLYIELAKRQFNEQDIVVHMLETYVKTQHSPRRNPSYEQFRTHLMRYLKALFLHLPALQRFEFYVHVLSTPAQQVRLELSLIVAQAVCVLFELHSLQYADSEEARHQIHEFLRCWPRLLQSQQMETRAVLLSIYTAVDFEAVASYDIDLLHTLETCCLDHFLNDETLTETEFHGLYTNLTRSVEASGNDQVHQAAADNLRFEYGLLQVHMNGIGPQDDQLPELLETYGKCLRRLHAMLEANKLRSDQVSDLYEFLALQLQQLAERNENLALYGCESLAYMLGLLFKQHIEEQEDNVVRLALQLRDKCVQELSKSTPELKRTKFHFCTILLLQLELQQRLTLESVTYDALLEQLSISTLALQARGNALGQSYWAEMHWLFRRLHASHQIALPSNRIWKVLQHYKMSDSSPELEQLAGVLIQHRLETYAHCLAVIQLHICSDRSSNKKRVAAAVAAHIQLIEKHASALDSWLLRLIIFNASLQLWIKNLSVRRPEAFGQRKRFMPLEQLMLLVAPLRLEQCHFMEIARFTYNLKMKAFGNSDKDELESFITQVSRHKYSCEDELTNAANNENFVGKLRAMPNGPLTKWQMKMVLTPLEENNPSLVGDASEASSIS